MSPVVSARRLSPFRVLSFLFANAIWIAALFLAPTTSASAQLTVTTLADSTDAGCTATCSLRDAITAADLAPGSTITFQGGLTGTITLGSALPAISANMTITGPGAGVVTVSGGGTVPAFSVIGAATALTVNISGLTVSNTAAGWNATGYGSALFVQANGGAVTVNVNSIVFLSNTGGSGGPAITNDGGTGGALVAVSDSTFQNNTSTTGSGGAIFNYGALTVTGSTFLSNTATQGSAIFIEYLSATQPGTATVLNSTFANNTSTGGSGGAILNEGATLTVANSTFSGNLPATGGAIANGGTLTLTNSILVEASGTSTSCTTATTGCPTNPTNPASATTGNVDDIAANLNLSSLGFYGGPTETFVPQTGSPAICGGITTDDGGITTDQRGFPLDASCAGGKLDSGSVQLTSLVVTNTNDSGTGSLRAAITTANAGEGDITFQSGVTGTINLASVLPSIEGVVNITGPGAGLLTINAPTGAAADRIFFVDHPGILNLYDVTLENGNATNAATDAGLGGGAILNSNFLSVDHVVFNNNTAGPGKGGAILNQDGTLQRVNACTFSNNTASTDNGGAIESTGPMGTISNSTFSGNTSGNNGSAVDDSSGSPLAVIYSTFSGNTATGYAALSILGGTLTVTNDTFSGNTGGAGAGDLYNDAGTMVVQNSVEAVADQCAGTGCPTNKTAGNIVADAALTLAALGNYGGPTATILPLPGSSAICGGLAADIPSGVTADQRGFSNVGPASYVPANCVDSGSVQTDYAAVQFVNPGAPYIGSVDIAGTTPPVVVSVTENGQNIGGVPVTLIFTGTGTATGLTATTVGGTGATFSGLTVDTVATGDDLSVSMLVVGTDTLAAGPEPLNIQAAGTTATTTTEAVPSPAGFDVSTTAVSVTLSATVTSAGTVNAGYVTFTVHSGSTAGAVVGTAVGSVPVTGGATGIVTYTIPANTVAGTYYIVAAYTDPGGSLASSNDSSKTIVINAAVTATTAIPTTTLTAGVAATAFTPVTGAGGTAPLSYSVLPALPSALTMSATTGQITGTPAAASAATVYTVTVKDANNATATATFTLTVNSVVTATTAIPTTTLTEGVAATAFTPVTGGGGTAPLSYGVAPALPTGLLYNLTTGQITGTPTVASAATTYTVTVTDANGETATATFSLTVSGAVSATTAVPTTILTEGHLATAFTPVTGAGGTAPLTFGVAPVLPAGLTMSTTTGQITGTPTVVSAATTYTVTVTDADNATATATFSLTVNGSLTATTAVPTTTLLADQPATPFTPVTGAGGTAPLTYAVAPTLPAGLTMSTTTGQITGTPTVTTNATTYTVTVTDANSATATATFSLTVNSATISITWANPSAITYGTSLAGVLDATVVYNGNTVPGTFAYTAQLTGGSAVPVTAATVLADGSYTLTASFTPTNTTTYGTPAPKSVPLTVNQAQPTIAWTPATSIPYGTSLAALLNATASFGGNSVAGSFAYTAQATGGSAVAVTGATVLVEGAYTLAVTFTPTDTTDYKTATASSPLAVTGGTLTVTASNATKVYGTANPTFTGTITGQQNGDTFTESFTTTATTTSNVGTYPIVPSATGANLSDYTVVIDDGTLTVTQAGSTTALTASGNTVNPGATLTLTATVASATSGTPTGTVSFYDGSTLLDTATLTAGVAAYSTTALLSGTHTITAVYSGDTNFTASSTSSALTITVPSLDFTMTAAPASQSGQAGNTFNYGLTLTPTFGTYPGTVSFAANGGPTGAVISFGPSTLAANSGTQTVYMSVATAAGSSALQPLDIGRKLAPVALAFLLLPFAGTRRMRRHGRRFGRLICLLLLALGGVAATTALSGCGSSPGGSSKTGGGTNYTITVTATSGTVTHTSTVTLTLQ